MVSGQEISHLTESVCAPLQLVGGLPAQLHLDLLLEVGHSGGGGQRELYVLQHLCLSLHGFLCMQMNIRGESASHVILKGADLAILVSINAQYHVVQ